jgi:hypothetical protein
LFHSHRCQQEHQEHASISCFDKNLFTTRWIILLSLLLAGEVKVPGASAVAKVALGFGEEAVFEQPHEQRTRPQHRKSKTRHWKKIKTKKNKNKKKEEKNIWLKKDDNNNIKHKLLDMVMIRFVKYLKKKKKKKGTKKQNKTKLVTLLVPARPWRGGWWGCWGFRRAAAKCGEFRSRQSIPEKRWKLETSKTCWKCCDRPQRGSTALWCWRDNKWENKNTKKILKTRRKQQHKSDVDDKTIRKQQHKLDFENNKKIAQIRLHDETHLPAARAAWWWTAPKSRETQSPQSKAKTLR